MKRISLSLCFLFCTVIAFCQTPTVKINATKGQQVIADINVDIEASMSMGMEILSKSSSVINFEIKDATPVSSVINVTLKKLKADMDMPGKTMSYDSEKPGDQDTEIGKGLSQLINKPSEVDIDNVTGKMVSKKVDSPERQDETGPMESMMQMFGGGTVESGPEGLFLLIPQGKKLGESWMDSTSDKSSKTVRSFTLKTVTGNEAVVALNYICNLSNEVEMQGMKMNVTTVAKSTGDIVTDITSGIVKKKNIVTETTGTMELMGQEMPINSKTTFSAVYK